MGPFLRGAAPLTTLGPPRRVSRLEPSAVAGPAEPGTGVRGPVTPAMNRFGRLVQSADNSPWPSAHDDRKRHIDVSCPCYGSTTCRADQFFRPSA